ncbi:Rv0361 family membrane protein [Nocardia jejuensis]|uniref:Rv0361 family membrane protein n=1 Tax=Nocardia jejuensis TaxID=328049 RepID=UPI000834373A|nr:hypothetical protein [Nocardia jejuensis]
MADPSEPSPESGEPTGDSARSARGSAEVTAEPPIPIDQGETRSMLPFLVAAGVIVLVVAGIVVSTLLSPAEKNLTDSGRVAIAARNFVQSRSETDSFDASTACANFDENRSPLNFPGASGKKIDLVKVENTAIEGDKATADVTFRVEGRESTGNWHFTRADSTWLVCTA